AQFYNIKFMKEVEGLSQRQIAKKLGISRNTVSKYLKQGEPPTTIHRKKGLLSQMLGWHRRASPSYPTPNV
ncbi:sigma factor-like helix-turn-helix DNA-binding protein, partial [Ectothiorhodospira haloalkaliphila]|uniref:sigma factor-like helix-turn-helix DNA-binding protein n=1 Tax=Ectothiorhodospira haloalkaliphila TaxID=421628 RepID=UPI0019394344